MSEKIINVQIRDAGFSSVNSTHSGRHPQELWVVGKVEATEQDRVFLIPESYFEDQLKRHNITHSTQLIGKCAQIIEEDNSHLPFPENIPEIVGFQL